VLSEFPESRHFSRLTPMRPPRAAWSR
jgi:hypothetical protein